MSRGRAAPPPEPTGWCRLPTAAAVAAVLDRLHVPPNATVREAVLRLELHAYWAHPRAVQLACRARRADRPGGT